MPTIQIPDGAKSMTLPSGQIIEFPEGAKSFDIPEQMMKPKAEPRESYDPFSETYRLIDDPVGTFQKAGEQIGQYAENIYSGLTSDETDTKPITDVGRDFTGGSLYGTGDLLKFAGETYSGGVIPAGMRLYNALSGGQETQGALENITDPISQTMMDKGIDIAQDPQSATFAVSSLAGAGEAGLAKGTQIAGKGIKAGSEMMFSSPEKATKLLSEWSKLSPDKQYEITKGLPASEIPEALAHSGGENTIGVQIKAMESGGDDARRAVGRELSGRVDIIDNAVASGNIKEVMKETKHMYGSMIKQVSKYSNNTFDGSVLLDDLNEISKLGARSDASERTINTLKNQLDNNPNMTIEDALNFRADINYELGKSKGKHTGHWEKLKSNVDLFIEKNTDPSMKDFIDTSVDIYSRSKNNEELVEILNKNKTNVGNAIDWSKAVDDIEKAGLKSPEVETALNIAKEFALKFGNDARLSPHTIAKGSGDRGGVLGTFSYFIDKVKDIGGAMIGDQTSRNHAVQKILLKSIMKSNRPQDVMTNVVKDPMTPKDVRNKLAEHLRKVRKINAIQGSSKQVSKNVETRLRNLQTKTNAKENTISKVELRIESMYDELDNIEKSIEQAIEKGKSTSSLRTKKLRLEKKIKIADRDLEKAVDDHASVKEQFDKELLDSGYTIDETGEFQKPIPAEPRSDIDIGRK